MHFLIAALVPLSRRAHSTRGRPQPAAGYNFVEPDSTFFATAFAEYAASYGTSSDGDLWPSAWADDDNTYAANGDGTGFSNPTSSDVVVNRISGTPRTGLAGASLSSGAAVAKVWGNPGDYNRKPTGMLAVDGNHDGRDELYIAVQDLRYSPGPQAFNDAPNASISMSLDYGGTWRKTSRPMFTDHVFTTIFFLDFGRSQGHAAVLGPEGTAYVYAYGLDGNWRDSYSNTVPSPARLYLARAPRASIQDRSTWEFYAGTGPAGRPRWSADIMTKDAGGYPWYGRPRASSGCPGRKNGGYGVTIPSKFISADGREMWAQSNWFVGNGCGSPNYEFSLRKFRVAPYKPTVAHNVPDASNNLARTGAGVTTIEKSAHFGHGDFYNDGITDKSEDSFDGSHKALDFWGYTFDRVVYTTGTMYGDGGWFGGGPRAQVRRHFGWTDVHGLSVTPPYPYDGTAGPAKSYTFRFSPMAGDGIRILGAPGGDHNFTSICELGAYYDGARHP